VPLDDAPLSPALNPQPSTLNPRRKLPWPKTLSERVKAVSTALATVKEPVTAAQMAKRFARANPADVGEILKTLCAMGKARRGPPSAKAAAWQAKAQGTFLP